MAIRPIVVVPHQALVEKAQDIKDIDAGIRRLARDMADTMYHVPAVSYTHLTLPTNREV